MKIVVAIILGLLGGLLIYFEFAMIYTSTNSNVGLLPSSLVLISLIGGWALCTYLMVNGAKSVSQVFSRGFLIGAALWLLLIPVMLVVTGGILSDVDISSDAEVVGAGIAGGIIGIFSWGLAIGMAVICLIGYAVSNSLGREMKVEAKDDRVKCPSCAELIQEEAKVCRFCGTQINNQSLSTSDVGPRTDTEEKLIIGKANTKWDSIKLRMEPDSRSDTVTRVKINTSVDIIGESGDWYQIVIPEDSIKGWLLKNSVDFIQD